MIDSTKAPAPSWKRYGTIALLVVLVVIAAVFIYTKELHHTSAPAPASSSVKSPAQSPAAGTHSAPTTIPGGIPVSSRNPFA